MADYDQFQMPDEESLPLDKHPSALPPVRVTPQVAFRLANRFERLLELTDFEVMTNSFEDLKESGIQTVRDLVQRTNERDLNEDFRRRWEALERAFISWKEVLCPDEHNYEYEDEDDIMPLSPSQQFQGHLRGFIAWLRELQIPQNTIEASFPIKNIALPVAIQDLHVRCDDRPEIYCGGQRFEPVGCANAMRVLEDFSKHPDQHRTLEELLKMLGDKMGGDAHALEQQIYILREQLRRQGGSLKAVADHFYSKRKSFGFWSMPKFQRAQAKRSRLQPPQRS